MPVLRRLGCSVLALGLLAGCAPPRTGPASSPTNNGAKADAVIRIVRDFMTQAHLKAVLVRVTVAGKEVVTRAVGDSMTGVPATTAMHFRNGAVAISYVATLLLKLVDEKKLRLDDKLSRWLPDFPHADRVTLGQLAQMTSGYPDYVLGNEAFDAELYANPFRQWTTQELLDQISSRPLLYDPGTNWNYAHTNYLLLGLALEKAAGQDMPTLLQRKVLSPLGLTATANSDTPAIPEPALHAFTSERRAALKIPAGVPFYEESTFWNPSWTITHGAIQTTTIYDMEATAVGIGRAGCSRRIRTRRWCRPSCAARPAPSRAAPPASSRTTATAMVSGSSYPAIGCCKIPCSPVTPRWRPICRRNGSRWRSQSPTPPRPSMTRATTATRPTYYFARSVPR